MTPTMNGRLPTQFELKVLRFIDKYHRIPAGDRIVQYAAAARRLERLGYTTKWIIWSVTQKGDEYLKGLS